MHDRPLIQRQLGIHWFLVVAIISIASSVGAEITAKTVQEILVSEWLARFEIAEGSANDTVGLNPLLIRALDRNRTLQAKAAQYDAATASIPQATSLPDPKLVYSEQLRSVETRVGPQRRALSLTQSFPWFGTLGQAGNVQQAKVVAARTEIEAAILDVVLGVKSEYAELAFLDQELRITRNHIDLLTRWEHAAEAGYATGRGRYADLIKVQVEIAILNDRLAGLVDRRGPVLAALNAWTDDPAGRMVTASLDSSALGVDFSLEPILGPMLSVNPALARWDAVAAGFEDSGRLARTRGRPTMTLGLNYIQVDESVMPDVQDTGRDAVSVSLGLSLPIWRSGFNAAVDEAAARRMAALASRADLVNTLTARLEKALFTARDAQRKVELYGSTLLPKAEQSLTAARTAYEAGEGGLLDMIDAERVFLEFEISCARAVADRQIAVATIEHLTATPLTE